MKINEFLKDLFGSNGVGEHIPIEKLYDLVDYLELHADDIVGIDTVNNGDIVRLSLILNQTDSKDLPGFGDGGSEPKGPKKPKPHKPIPSYVFEIEM